MLVERLLEGSQSKVRDSKLNKCWIAIFVVLSNQQSSTVWSQAVSYNSKSAPQLVEACYRVVICDLEANDSKLYSHIVFWHKRLNHVEQCGSETG